MIRQTGGVESAPASRQPARQTTGARRRLSFVQDCGDNDILFRGR